VLSLAPSSNNNKNKHKTSRNVIAGSSPSRSRRTPHSHTLKDRQHRYIRRSSRAHQEISAKFPSHVKSPSDFINPPKQVTGNVNPPQWLSSQLPRTTRPTSRPHKAPSRPSVGPAIRHFLSSSKNGLRKPNFFIFPSPSRKLKSSWSLLQRIEDAHADACNAVTQEIPDSDLEELRESRKMFRRKYLRIRSKFRIFLKCASLASIASPTNPPANSMIDFPTESSPKHAIREESSPLDNGNNNNSSSAAPECIASHFPTSTSPSLPVEAPAAEHSAILLPTAVLIVLDWVGNWRIVRALIDSDSESNRITRHSHNSSSYQQSEERSSLASPTSIAPSKHRCNFW
jgi:hypothetical protein